MKTLFTQLPLSEGITDEATQYSLALLEVLDLAQHHAKGAIDPEKISRIIRLIEALTHDITAGVADER